MYQTLSITQVLDIIANIISNMISLFIKYFFIWVYMYLTRLHNPLERVVSFSSVYFPTFR